MKAKKISKVFKFISAFGVIACAILKWVGCMPDATVKEIVVIWSAVYAIGAGTVDLNLIFDKFLGGKSECTK